MTTGDIRIGIFLSACGWRVVYDGNVPDLFFATPADAVDELNAYLTKTKECKPPSEIFAQAFESLTGRKP